MRFHRLLTALIAVALIGFMPVAAGTGAHANNAAAAAKIEHDLIAKGKEASPGKFVAFGKVSTYKNRKITIQRARCDGGCRFNFYKTTFTDRDDGRFYTRIYKGSSRVACFKVVVPETARYKTTKQQIGCIRPA